MALFTAETAKELARKSVEARAAKRKALELQALAAKPDNLPPLDPSEQFQSERLARVRTQLRMIDSMIEGERDAQKLDRLASAQSKLAEQERILAGRPLPGSHRPSAPRSKSKPAQFGPLD